MRYMPTFKEIFRTIALSLILVLGGMLAASCTSNQRARSYGGEQTIAITKGWKVVNASWKDDDLWILVRPMKPEEQPEKLTYIESSSYGIAQGKIYLQEQK